MDKKVATIPHKDSSIHVPYWSKGARQNRFYVASTSKNEQLLLFGGGEKKRPNKRFETKPHLLEAEYCLLGIIIK